MAGGKNNKGTFADLLMSIKIDLLVSPCLKSSVPLDLTKSPSTPGCVPPVAVPSLQKNIGGQWAMYFATMLRMLLHCNLLASMLDQPAVPGVGPNSRT